MIQRIGGSQARLAGRGLVLLLVSIAVGYRIYRDEWHWHEAGRDAFLQAQTLRFDRFYLHPSPGKFLGITLTVAVGLTLYELLAFGAGTVLARTLPLDPKEK